MVKVAVIDDPEAMAEFTPGWEEMAVEAGAPFSSPAWLLPWWEHVGRRHGAMRVVVAHDAGEVVGVLPLWAERTRTGLFHYRLMAADISHGVTPLWRAGVDEAQAALSGLLRATPPMDVLRMEGLPDGTSWSSVFHHAWPGRHPWIDVERSEEEPFVDLSDVPADGWLAVKSSKFRRRLRAVERKLDEAGFVTRVVTSPEEVASRLPSFARLHRARWAHRGGSGVFGDGLAEMLGAASSRFGDSGRFQLWTVERDGGRDIIAAHVVLRAGDRAEGWLSGFDAEQARLRAMLHSKVAAIDHAGRSGVKTFSLGTGVTEDKLELTRDVRTLRWWRMTRRGWRRPHTPVQLLPWPARKRMRWLVG